MSVFYAEWQKTLRNKWMIGFTMWVWPVGALAVLAVVGLITLLTGADPETLNITEVNWQEQMRFAWSNVSNVFGQLLIAAFTASVFAGESNWHTWKNLVPRNRRVTLLLSKYAVVLLVVFIAFNLMAIFAAIGSQIIALAAGAETGPLLFSDETAAFLSEYLILVLTTYAQAIQVVLYASLAALLMRSIIAGAIAATGALLVDLALPLVLFLLGNLLEYPELMRLHTITPGYNVNNLRAWWLTDSGVSMYPEVYEPLSADTSLLLIGIWFVGLVLLSLFLFTRRDVG